MLGAPLQAVAQQQPPKTVRINYVNADLGDVIRSLATELGVNVMLTDVPTRRITFQAPEAVPVPQEGAVPHAILHSQGPGVLLTRPAAQAMPQDEDPATEPVRV